MKFSSSAPGLLVVFGITGDLSKKKLLPALYHLACDDLLPSHFEIIGITRRNLSAKDIVTAMQIDLEKREGPCDRKGLEKLSSMIRIVTMDMTKSEDYRQLKIALDQIEDEHATCLNRLFYLSIPPQTYGPVVRMLGESKLNTGCQHGSADSRLMVEKPFGYDLESAEALIAELKASFKEEQIYRIDHYLAKETAQNILIFRFSNPIFRALWDHSFIESITVTASESIGIESRAAFYEPIGALRDFIQSHLIQLLATVTMDEPVQIDAAHTHAAKLKLLKAIVPIKPDEVAAKAQRGQYIGYRDEVKNPDSFTETFARVELTIDTERWRGVPVALETGKRLAAKTTEIALVFSDPKSRHEASNTLIFRIQPNEGIVIDLLAKKPGFDNDADKVEMTFSYHEYFGGGAHPDAYERVLMDGIRGDQSLFATSEEVLASWRVLESVVQAWGQAGQGLEMYEPGTAISDLGKAKKSK